MTTPALLQSDLEVLLFFASLLTEGVSSASFRAISDHLRATELIRSSPSYDAARLSPEALQTLYLRLLQDEVRAERNAGPVSIQAQSDAEDQHDSDLKDLRGDGSNAPELASRKRKLPSPPLLQSLQDATSFQYLLPPLVNRLYARYRDQAIRDLAEEERHYQQLQRDVNEIERGDWDTRLQESSGRSPVTAAAPTTASASSRVSAPPRHNGPFDRLVPDLRVQPQPPSALRQESDAVSRRPNGVAQRPSGEPRTIPSPDLRAGPLDSQRLDSAELQARTQQSDFGNRHASQDRSNHTSTASHLSPHPPATARASTFAEAVPGAPRNPSPRSLSLSSEPIPHTPHGILIPPHLQKLQGPATPGTSSATTPRLPPSAPPYPNANAVSTPANLSHLRRHSVTSLPPINTSVSSTRWKGSPRRSAANTQRSPTQPERSPYLPSSPSGESSHSGALSGSNDGDSGPERELKPRRKGIKKERLNDTPGPRGRWAAGHGSRVMRSGRPGSTASSAFADLKNLSTRSESLATPTDELSLDSRAGLAHVKHEAPATPAGGNTDDSTSIVSMAAASNETIRPSRRRDTFRSADLTRPDLKRKRADTLEPSPEVGSRTSMPPQWPTRAGQILASRNFPRVVAPLLNDINSHKLASVFAKPITDRDAPGYHALIYHPQDLKSIRSAISGGSRAVAAAAAAANNNNAASASADSGGNAGDEAGTPAATSAATSKMGNVWVERSDEVVPPRGIVNSAQLEKELCRIFANAVMFNPDPDRGFGPAFRPPPDTVTSTAAGSLRAVEAGKQRGATSASTPAHASQPRSHARSASRRHIGQAPSPPLSTPRPAGAHDSNRLGPGHDSSRFASGHDSYRGGLGQDSYRGTQDWQRPTLVAHESFVGAGDLGENDDDEGSAFVRDAREMFAGVERSVTAWRGAERASLGDNFDQDQEQEQSEHEGSDTGHGNADEGQGEGEGEGVSDGESHGEGEGQSDDGEDVQESVEAERADLEHETGKTRAKTKERPARAAPRRTSRRGV